MNSYTCIPLMGAGMVNDKEPIGIKSENMENRIPEDITGMLADWNGGDTEALDRLMDLVYPELRRIARRNLRREH